MNLIFDFDGTICDSIKPAIEAVNTILAEIGIKKTDLNEVRNEGLKSVIKSRNIPLWKVHKMVSKYRDRAEKISEIALPVRGMESVIPKLSLNHKLGIVTTNKNINVEKFLKRYRLLYFDFIHSEKNIFGKDKTLKKVIIKYKLKPQETYYIGDETRDIEAAKKQKIKTAAVIWGAESQDLLKKSNPDKIISTPHDLLKL